MTYNLRVGLRRTFFVGCRRLSALLAVCLLPVPASAQAGSGAVARDSAGVRIVESVSPAWSPATRWIVSSNPAQELGGADAAEEFHQVESVLRLAKGHYVVADRGNSQLRFYDSKGARIRVVGRSGDGPGEFGAISSLYRFDGDTVGVRDDQKRAIHLFTPEGRYLKTLTLHGSRRSAIQGVVEGGYIVFSEAAIPLSIMPGERENVYVSFWHTDQAGQPASRIATVEGDAYYGRDGAPPTAVALGGRPIPHVHQGSLVLGIPARYEIRRYAFDGRLVSIYRPAWSPRQVDRQIQAEYRAAFVARMGGSGAAAGTVRDLERHIEETTLFADRLPAFSQLLVDGVGNIWVRRYTVSDGLPRMQSIPLPGSESRWDVFDIAGRWLGEVVMPSGFYAFDIGEDYIVGLSRDVLDIERVRVLQLVKP